MDTNFYTYVYLDPRKPGIYTYDKYVFDYEPFYVGKGCGNRMYEHLRLVDKDPYNPHKVNRIKKIQADTGRDPIIQQINGWDTAEYALTHEMELIAIIGRYDLGNGPLLNATDGGDGAVNPSAETRLLISQRMSGEQNPNWGGKALTENHVSVRNKQLVGARNQFFGKSHTDETKQLLSLKRKNESDATKAKRSETYKQTRQQKAELWSERYLITAPDGTEYVVTTGLEKFLKEHQLPYGTFLDMLRLHITPKRGKCVGWKIVKIQKETK